jgi:putative peptidoglycan lipid II flippase
LLQVVAANAVMWLVIYFLKRPLTWWLDAAIVDRVIWLTISIVAGAGAYLAVLLALGLRPSKLGIKPH